jgi:hypothetical protein
MMGVDLPEIRKLISARIRDANTVIGAKDLTDIAIEEPVQEVIESVEVPWYWIDVNDDCQQLLSGRRILEAPFLPKDLRFYYCKTTKRLVIPWMTHGNMDTYQTRALYADQDIKYKFKYGGDKGIFGLDSIDMSIPYIFTHEGVFDSIFMLNSVACGGIAPNNSQLNSIQDKYPTHEIVYFLDNPWKDKSSRDYIIKLGGTNPKQLVFLWDKANQCKDINDDVIYSNDIMKYSSLDKVKGGIYSALQAKMALLFNKMP